MPSRIRPSVGRSNHAPRVCGAVGGDEPDLVVPVHLDPDPLGLVGAGDVDQSGPAAVELRVDGGEHQQPVAVLDRSHGS